MKKRIFLICLATLSLSLSACGNTKTEETKDKPAIETSVSKSGVDAGNEATSKLSQINLNTPYSVKTSEGTYNFTITGIRKTDWNDTDSTKIAVLEYTVENVDYAPSDGSMLVLDSFALHIKDTAGKECEPWDTTMSEFGFPDIVEVGQKKQQEQPYVIEKDAKQVSVIFQNLGVEEAAITLDLK